MGWLLGCATTVLGADLASKSLIHGQLVPLRLGTASVFIALASLALLIATVKNHLRYLTVAIPIGLIAGGAIATLLDYALQGHVEDIIPIGPVMTNVADIACLVGFAGMVFGLRKARRGIG
jgi:lipoprotein signal peptidase